MAELLASNNLQVVVTLPIEGVEHLSDCWHIGSADMIGQVEAAHDQVLTVHYYNNNWDHMDQIIFDDLRFEIDEKINKDKMSINQECYSQNKQTLEGAGAYAECYQKRVIELA